MPVTLGDKSDTSQFVFRKGESFTAVVYSNTAGTIRGNVRVVYDDGTEDDFKFNETSSGSSRAGVILTCAPHVTARPGIVVSMFLGVSGAINQRGMCFAQVWMTNDPQSSGAITLIAQGYVYVGSPLILGVYVEPGPAGGHGSFSVKSTADPAAAAAPSCKKKRPPPNWPRPASAVRSCAVRSNNCGRKWTKPPRHTSAPSKSPPARPRC